MYSLTKRCSALWAFARGSSYDFGIWDQNVDNYGGPYNKLQPSYLALLCENQTRSPFDRFVLGLPAWARHQAFRDLLNSAKPTWKLRQGPFKGNVGCARPARILIQALAFGLVTSGELRLKKTGDLAA